ncbi:MAG: HPr family phosphocarrier protein [Phycisphaerales bacterium]|nr:HPr family phosphocarrier protein [Phycisphaerales bacterium]
MVSAKATIINRLGLHARPAMAFVQLANRFSAVVQVRREDSNEVVDGKSIMQMLLLAGTAGTVLVLSADGVDESDAINALVRLIASRFDED